MFWNSKNKQKETLVEEAIRLGVKIGKNPRIVGTTCWGSEPFLIEIGNDVCISSNVTFLTHDGSIHSCRPFYDYGEKIYKFGRIIIGDNCFIGCNSTILPNVTIGNNCVVGAGSVVTKSIPDGEVWAGNPAKFITTIEKLAQKVKKHSDTPEMHEMAELVDKKRCVDLRINIFLQNEREMGSSRIRFFNLLSKLKKLFATVFIASDKSADIIIFQKINCKKKLLSAKKSGIFCCFDIDDYFPEMFDDMIKYSDLVITSTEYLREKLLKLNKNVIVIPNSLDVDDYNIPLASRGKNEETKFCWYGWSANSYILDKLNLRDLVTTISDVGDIKYDINTIDEEIQKFDYVIIPQEQNEHTLAKTHCRMLKALYLGVPVIFSNMPEYVKLAEELGYPKEYMIEDNTKFREFLIAVKEGKIKLPDINFSIVRRRILTFYSKLVIAELLQKHLKEQYSDFKRKKDLFPVKIYRRLRCIKKIKFF